MFVLTFLYETFIQHCKTMRASFVFVPTVGGPMPPSQELNRSISIWIPVHGGEGVGGGARAFSGHVEINQGPTSSNLKNDALFCSSPVDVSEQKSVLLYALDH